MGGRFEGFGADSSPQETRREALRRQRIRGEQRGRSEKREE
jgi:hypothetical protein